MAEVSAAARRVGTEHGEITGGLTLRNNPMDIRSGFLPRKCLANYGEIQSARFLSIMQEINGVARAGSLREYNTYSRIWEYPWLWLQLEPLSSRRPRLIDVGSEQSPLPWFLATRGYQVTVSDVKANYWSSWQKASRSLSVSVEKKILDSQRMDLPTASLDVYLSVSVIEHVPNKVKVISEAARVLRPGGILVMTFDVCEPGMGMTFPEWNGRALTMEEFDSLFRSSPFFESELCETPWNSEDIADYWGWHRTTAAHHNYITGAAVVRRNDRLWVERPWKDQIRGINGMGRTACNVAKWHLRHGAGMLKTRLLS
jgi:SAM-dependent methyltransferase